MKPIDYIMIGLGLAALATAVAEAMGVFTLRIDARGMSLIGLVLMLNAFAIYVRNQLKSAYRIGEF